MWHTFKSISLCTSAKQSACRAAVSNTLATNGKDWMILCFKLGLCHLNLIDKVFVSRVTKLEPLLKGQPDGAFLKCISSDPVFVF